MSAAEPPRVSLTLLQKPPPPFSDEALALRFAEQHKDDLRYIAKTGRWLEWDGTRWKRDDTLRVIDLWREICREASAECNSQTESKEIASRRTVNAVEALARADRRLAAETNQWDRDPWLLNTPAGTIELRTGQLREHRRDEHITRITPVSPSPGCPRFMKFLLRIMTGDEEVIRYLARIAGYCLTGITREQCMFFLHGQGSNGKGVLMNILREALGDYAKTAPIETFLRSKSDRHPTEVADLDGPRLVVANEPDAGREWNESRIKQMTGGDNVKGRFMGQDWFEFTPQFKLVIIGNHKPRFRVVSYAMRRRVKLISFDVTIPPEEVDMSLLEKLSEELGGILQWMIDGCREWQRIGLSVPRAVKEATENYLDQEDTFGQWLNACCQRVAGAWTSTEDLISSWVIFAKGAGEDPGDEKEFREAMEGHGLDKKRTNSRRGYAGVTLKSPDTP